MVSTSNLSRLAARKNGIFAIILVLISTTLFAQPTVPDNLNMEPLRDWLKVNWYQPYFDDLGYNGARNQMFGYTDEENDVIHGIYTGFEQASIFTTYLNPINTEHIVPQSFFGSLSPMKSDLFNIRPSHGNANSSRGNSPYGEVIDENAQWYGIDASGNYVTQGNIPTNLELWTERSGNLWEPRDDAKGDIARLVFYFYTMYPTEAGDMASIGNIETLYAWHLEDPISTFESTRNDRVQEVQGNANPYISDPELVMRAWFWTGSSVPGCMDESACNFNLDATSDDGSCLFAETGLDCEGNILTSCTLYFSEYGEGSSNNKYLEIYNPGIESISLDGFALAHTVNAPSVPGTYETWVELPVNGVIEPQSVYLIVHSQAEIALLNIANFTYGNLSNGDDGFALVIGSPADYNILDAVGDWNGDPGTGWDVAGTSSATTNHTLIRKPTVSTGNAGDWTPSAGTSEDDSEWLVLEMDNWDDVGAHAADAVCDPSSNETDDVLGCYYTAACNFNEAATQDDGSCEFESCVLLGCTYLYALNYSEEANDDDGTCIFGNTEGECASDINMDGTVSVSDLLLLLTEFGQGC
ncbi:MAG: endonuclease [Flavobacteriales bacterium]|nr:endonuclease [Flavobacteriales bacterium]